MSHDRGNSVHDHCNVPIAEGVEADEEDNCSCNHRALASTTDTSADHAENRPEAAELQIHTANET